MSDKLVEQQFFIEHVLKEAFPAGMSIREMEVTQFGMTQQAHEQPTFSVQQ